MLLGAVADDLTGATDLCLMLTREGMRTIQIIGLPEKLPEFSDADAVVIALKSRTIDPAEAVDISKRAGQRLLDAGARQLIFKYCSTFDSTPKGNIGPVAEALLALVEEDVTIVCPAFPENGRTIYQGHLFVGETLLSDSPMRNHPLTPMTDLNLCGFCNNRRAVALVLFLTPWCKKARTPSPKRSRPRQRPETRCW